MRRTYGLGMVALLLAGCATPPSEDPRIAEQCTDITNVVGRNYELATSFKARASSGLFRWGPQYKLSTKEAERQIILDRLCRQFAVGQLSEEGWIKAHSSYSLASAEGIPVNDPVAIEKLKVNLDDLHSLLAKLDAYRGGTGATAPAADEQLARIIRATKQDYEAMKVDLVTLSSSVGGLGTSNASILRALELNKRQQLQILDELKVVQSRLPDPARQPAPAPAVRTWQAIAVFRVKFSLPSAALDEASKALLRKQLSTLSGAEDFRVDLAGYADASGGLRANVGLSWERASAVQNFLVSDMHMDPIKVTVQGRGVRNDGPAAENRVVEVKAFALVRPATSPR